MRTSLFLSSLFAVSLIGGAALADNAPRSLTKVRSNGDQMDKQYKSVATRHTSPQAAATTRAATPARQLKTNADARITCSQEGVDCAARTAAPRTTTTTKTATTSQPNSSEKNPLAAKQASRVNCGPGDECSSSSKATKAVSSGKQASDVQAAPSMVSAAKNAAYRKLNQAYEARMACNEGEECHFSSKEAKKIWRLEAFKAGTVDANSKANDFTNNKSAQKDQMLKARHDNKDEKKH